eukprot:2097962-Prorocentrum_lima.AAC.1
MGWMATPTKQRGLHSVPCPIPYTKSNDLGSDIEGMAKEPLRHLCNTGDQEQPWCDGTGKC